MTAGCGWTACLLAWRVHCQGMMHFSEASPLSSSSDAPAGYVRLAAAAYLGRFKGSSRGHTESDLRCYLTWCAERGLDPLAARRADLELYVRWRQELARDRRGSEDYREGYAEARRAFLIGRAVRERRLALGLSQTELATRVGMTQPALSRLEAGGVVPTIPLLERISIALDADLIVQIAPHAA